MVHFFFFLKFRRFTACHLASTTYTYNLKASQLILDIAFCGDWAGVFSVYNVHDSQWQSDWSSCGPNTYFEINSICMYTVDGLAPSISS